MDFQEVCLLIRSSYHIAIDLMDLLNKSFWLLETDVAQLPGRLFRPSDISKKQSHHFLLPFPIGMGPYDHHAKYQGVFLGLL